ncbi:MAG TPA: hypothetical protein VJY33_08795 [Isosphaeraceae bacterium]|nr:hypothetical protein [Isosphaeraceae bacterium]
MFKKYIVRLTDQERTELAVVINKLKGKCQLDAAPAGAQGRGVGDRRVRELRNGATNVQKNSPSSACVFDRFMTIGVRQLKAGLNKVMGRYLIAWV